MAKEWDLDPLGGDIWVDTLEHFEPQIPPNSLGLQKHPASSLVNKGNYTSHGNYATQMRQVPYQTVFTSGSVLTTPCQPDIKYLMKHFTTEHFEPFIYILILKIGALYKCFWQLVNTNLDKSK